MGEETRNGGGVVTVTAEEGQALIDRAHEREKAIVRWCRVIQASWAELAKEVYGFIEQREWELLGYDSPEQFFASPETETISYGHAMKLKRVYEEFHERRGASMDELRTVDVAKLQKALPAVKSGTRHWTDVLADARALPRSDFEIKYEEENPDAPLDASKEPERRRCPTCRSYVRADRIQDAA